MTVHFKAAKTAAEIESVFNYTIDAFSDAPDFNWTLANIKKEIKDGWELYAVLVDAEVIAAAFYKRDDEVLLTKNTAIKTSFQGSGHSHEIKQFFESKAKEFKLKRIIHYCSIDDFRMYSLNESHGYEKIQDLELAQELVVSWVKKL